MSLGHYAFPLVLFGIGVLWAADPIVAFANALLKILGL
jgi:hypothetical protein